MRKLLAAFLAVALVFAAGACSKGGEEETGPVTLTPAQATAEIERSLASVRSAEKAAVTFTYVEKSTKQGVLSSMMDLNVTFLFDKTQNKFLMEAVSEQYNALAPDAQSGPVLEARYYAEPAAGGGGKYNIYDVMYDADGSINETASKYHETSESFAQAVFYTYLTNGYYLESSLFPLAFLYTAQLSGAVRDKGETTIDEKTKSVVMAQLGRDEDILLDIKGNIQKNGEAKLNLSGVISESQILVSELAMGVEIKHDAQMPALDFAGVQKAELGSTESDYLMNNLGELTELYTESEITDGTIKSTHFFDFTEDERWSIFTAEKATVYTELNSDKTYYDFTDSAKQDVYYNSRFDPAHEDIGQYVETGPQNDLNDNATVSYDMATGKLTMTADNGTFELFMSEFALPYKLVTVIGGKTYTQTFTFTPTLQIPTQEFLAGFTLKQPAA